MGVPHGGPEMVLAVGCEVGGEGGDIGGVETSAEQNYFVGFLLDEFLEDGDVGGDGERASLGQDGCYLFVVLEGGEGGQ